MIEELKQKLFDFLIEVEDEDNINLEISLEEVELLYNIVENFAQKRLKTTEK